MRDAGLILDWDTLTHTDKFYQAKTTRLVTLPLAPWHSSCQHLPHILCILDIICQENMTLPVIMVTASLLTVNGRSARLLYLLTFSSLWQVGGWEPGSSQDVTLPLIPGEDRETNTYMLYERILLEASQSVGSNPKVTRTLCRWHQVGDW